MAERSTELGSNWQGDGLAISQNREDLDVLDPDCPIKLFSVSVALSELTAKTLTYLLLLLYTAVWLINVWPVSKEW